MILVGLKMSNHEYHSNLTEIILPNSGKKEYLTKDEPDQVVLWSHFSSIQQLILLVRSQFNQFRSLEGGPNLCIWFNLLEHITESTKYTHRLIYTHACIYVRYKYYIWSIGYMSHQWKSDLASSYTWEAFDSHRLDLFGLQTEVKSDGFNTRMDAGKHKLMT